MLLSASSRNINRGDREKGEKYHKKVAAEPGPHGCSLTAHALCLVHSLKSAVIRKPSGLPLDSIPLRPAPELDKRNELAAMLAAIKTVLRQIVMPHILAWIELG